ncbi:MAG: hypothetical protein ABR608_03205 [Pseudonocardiaceae bacterium]
MSDTSAPEARRRIRRWPNPPPSYDLPIFQLQGERERLVVVGRRTDDNDRCELLLVAEVGGSFALYPHGAAPLGVRLAEDGAVTVARAILAAVESAPHTERREGRAPLGTPRTGDAG